MRKSKRMLVAALLAGGAGFATIVGIDASAEKPVSIDDPDWKPGRFVQIAHPDGGVVRSLDGEPVLFDRNLLSLGTARGPGTALVLWRVVGDDAKDQADADRRIAQAIQDLSNGTIDQGLTLSVAVSEEQPAE